MAKTCSTCRWWVFERKRTSRDRKTVVTEGRCHRSAPSVVDWIERNVNKAWPLTFSEDFCGEHEDKPDAD